MTPARITHLCAPAPFGGLEQVVASLSAAQAEAGHDVHVGLVLDLDAPGPPALRALAETPVEVHRVHLPARAYLRERRFVRGLCEGVRPDVVHTHGYRSDVLHGPVARSLGLPTVTTVHGFTGGGWKNRLYETLQRRAFRRCDAVVAVSRPLAVELADSGVPEERLHTIPNAWTRPVEFLEGAEARRVLDVPADAFSIGFVGRIDRVKGADVFVEAVGRVEDPVTAVLIGTGPSRPELMERARALGMSGRIRWPGSVDRAARLMKAFDLLVLSSRSEGTPMVLLEAMAAGVPLAATVVGGVPDVVGEGEATLVPPEDPGALADAIRGIMEDPEGAARRARRARERLRCEFGADRWLERYDHVYRTCGAAREAAHA